MEVLTSLLTSGQLGQLKEMSQSVSLEEVAEVASSGFRSLSATREDSLVFVLGLLNMATVLLYAVYADVFKPARMSWASTIGSPSDDQHFFYKKIQNILDELVLHVHTSTYYRNAIERARLSSRFQGRSGESSAFHGLLSFFEMPGLAAKDTAASSRRTRDEYDVYLKREARKLMQEWISVLVQSTFAETLSGRLFKRHVTHRSNATASEQRAKKRSSTSRSPRMDHQVDDEHLEHDEIDSQQADAVVRHLTKRQVSQQNRTTFRRMRPHGRRQPGAQRRMLPISMQPKVVGQQKSEEWKNHSPGPMTRRRPIKQPEQPSTTTTTTTTTTTPAPSTTERFRQEVPVLPVQGLFPHGSTVRQGNAGQTSGRDNTPAHAKVMPGSAPRQQAPPPLYYDGELDLDASGSSPTGAHSTDNSLVDRLMHLVQQTTPLAMDVLHVFKIQSDPAAGQQQTELKCLERQLCQLNQEWKRKGIVSAALAPFLSISLGWWRDRTSGPSLPDALMAVRAGWIGKHCATLYPRCSNTGRPKWAVVPTSGDSANQQSVDRPPIKLPPPVGFVNHQQPVRQPPAISQVVQRPPATPVPMRKKDETPPDWSGEEREPVRAQRPIESRLDDLSPSSSVATGTLQVDNVASNTSVKGDPDAANKPWGKPSRFPVPGNVELSDIVRGVYPPSDQAENEADDNEDEEEENDDDEDDEDEEDDDGDITNQSSTEKVSSHFTEEILHDLKKNHFSGSTKAPTTQTNSTKAPETKSAELIKYEEMQKKKTHRLEMVPYRGLVHPWLADPVWAQESRWPGKPAPVSKQAEDETDATERHRDRVSFGHEDAVKDYRIHDYAMQFLRDRSA